MQLTLTGGHQSFEFGPPRLCLMGLFFCLVLCLFWKYSAFLNSVSHSSELLNLRRLWEPSRFVSNWSEVWVPVNPGTCGWCLSEGRLWGMVSLGLRHVRSLWLVGVRIALQHCLVNSPVFLVPLLGKCMCTLFFNATPQSTRDGTSGNQKQLHITSAQAHSLNISCEKISTFKSGSSLRTREG